MLFIYKFIFNYRSFIDYWKSMRLQTLLMGTFAILVGLQLLGKFVFPHILHRFRYNDLIKVNEAQIDLSDLFHTHNRQFARLQHHNESIYHDFHVNVNETTSTITISSSVLAMGKNNTRTMQISSVKIRMANLSNADLTLSTQFITNLAENVNFADRHQEHVQLI